MGSSKLSLYWPFADWNFGDLVNGHGHSPFWIAYLAKHLEFDHSLFRSHRIVLEIDCFVFQKSRTDTERPTATTTK